VTARIENAARNDGVEIDGVEQVAVGEFHVCLRLATGTITCFSDGAVKHDGFMRSFERTILPEVNDAVDLCAGYMQACAVRANGDVWCWGDPYSSSVHIGSIEPPGVRVRLPEPAKKVSCGKSSSCAVLRSGRIACWGDHNYGARPDEAVIVQTPPAFEVASSLEQVCAATAEGVMCWRHWPGDRYPPDSIVGLGDTSQVANGGTFACALTNGAVKCWGANDRGQLGGAATERWRDAPVRVPMP
jgi:alpha-tubulin suppressor-like RCC1 family protein